MPSSSNPKKYLLPEISRERLSFILWGDSYVKGPKGSLCTESIDLFKRAQLIDNRGLFAVPPDPDHSLKKMGLMIKENSGKDDLASINGIWCTADEKTAKMLGKAFRGKILRRLNQNPPPLTTTRSN